MAFPGNLVRATPSQKKDKRPDYNRGIVSLCNFRNFLSFYGESGEKEVWEIFFEEDHTVINIAEEKSLPLDHR